MEFADRFDDERAQMADALLHHGGPGRLRFAALVASAAIVALPAAAAEHPNPLNWSAPDTGQPNPLNWSAPDTGQPNPLNWS